MSRKSPYFVLYKDRLVNNLELLATLEKEANITILHTLKSFNELNIILDISKYISGFSASSKSELKLAKEAEAKRVHLYSPAFLHDELNEFIKDATSVSFNSLSQWDRFNNLDISKGLRLNSKLNIEMPNYCNYNSQNSHLGVDYKEFLECYMADKNRFENLEGLHFHSLFKSDYKGAKSLLQHILYNYKELLDSLKWINLGGGHNFTDINYNKKEFLKEIASFKALYPHIELIFEPGEGVLHRCGEFVCRVLDIAKNGNEVVAIVDTSTETHLLDIAITKLKPKIKSHILNGEYSYKICGNSCQNGDVIGRFSFDKALKIGDELIFEDMLSYTLVKTTTFGGANRPKLYIE